MTKQVPVAPDVFTWPSDQPSLIASERDGVVSFPARQGEERRLLPRRGRLWAFTSQQFRPVSPPYDGNDTPETFQPYTLGYVEFADELIVQGRFTEPDHRKLHIGMEMEVVVVPYTTSPDGTETVTYAFAPVAEAGA